MTTITEAEEDSPAFFQLVKDAAQTIRNFVYNGSFKKVPNAATEFFKKCPLNMLRKGTMELIRGIHTSIKEIKGGDPTKPIEDVLVELNTWLHHNMEDNIKVAVVSQTLWETCFKLAAGYNPSNKQRALDTLFRICAPESNERKAMIDIYVDQLLGVKATFIGGVEWAKAFDNIKEKKFDQIIYKSFIYGHDEKFLKNVLTTFNDKLRCTQLLDGCLWRADENKPRIQLEKEFIAFITVQKLLLRLQAMLQEYNIDGEKHGFYVSRKIFMKEAEMRRASSNIADFELWALKELKGRPSRRELDFLQVISKEKKYAYAWARYLKIRKIPNFLKNCEKHDEYAENFVTKMNETLFKKDEDCIVTREIWGQKYNVIVIVTKSAFLDFVKKYFIESKPKILGIDCEAGFIDDNVSILIKQKITLLQLATDNWLCLIDVKLLYDKLSESQWKCLFEHIFDPNIIRVGFDFTNDYGYICNAFPFLEKTFQEKERKILCLQKLVSAKKFSGIINGNLIHPCGLATLAKEVLNITINKSLQSSNWSRRPLRTDQKIYAVSDALANILIYGKIKALFKEKHGEKQADENMKHGHIWYKVQH